MAQDFSMLLSASPPVTKTTAFNSPLKLDPRLACGSWLDSEDDLFQSRYELGLSYPCRHMLLSGLLDSEQLEKAGG